MDQELAQRAAEFLFQRVKELKRHNVIIPYDFEFNESRDQLYCSETVAYMYEKISNGKFTFPLFPNNYEASSFLASIGIYTDPSIFHPSDMELDIRFDLVAEWRNPNYILKIHQSDAIFSSIFDWMENKGYHIEHHAFSKMAPTLIKFPILKQIYQSYINQKIPKKFLKTFLTMLFIEKHLRKKLNKIEKKSIRKNGYPLSHNQRMEFLEKYRLEKLVEFNEYKAYKKEKDADPFSALEEPDQWAPTIPYLYRLITPFDED